MLTYFCHLTVGEMWVVSNICISGLQSYFIVSIRFFLQKYDHGCLTLELGDYVVDAWLYLPDKLTFTINSFRARHRHAWTRCSEVLPSTYGRGGRYSGLFSFYLKLVLVK